jgi:hypothetical protein
LQTRGNVSKKEKENKAVEFVVMKL